MAKMSGFFAVLVLINAPLALACPNLTGTYKCDSGTTKVSQQEVDGVTEYTMNFGEDFYTVKADGKAYSMPDREEIKKATIQATCLSDVELAAVVKGKYYSEGTEAGDLQLNVDALKLSNGNLKQKSEIVIGDQKLESEETCVRQ